MINVFLFLTVSLQDINMKKAFKSSTIQDQQVVSKNSIPNPVADIYNQSDKPPPLNILSPYRYGNIVYVLLLCPFSPSCKQRIITAEGRSCIGD